MSVLDSYYQSIAFRSTLVFPYNNIHVYIYVELATIAFNIAVHLYVHVAIYCLHATYVLRRFCYR